MFEVRCSAFSRFCYTHKCTQCAHYSTGKFSFRAVRVCVYVQVCWAVEFVSFPFHSFACVFFALFFLFFVLCFPVAKHNGKIVYIFAVLLMNDIAIFSFLVQQRDEVVFNRVDRFYEPNSVWQRRCMSCLSFRITVVGLFKLNLWGRFETWGQFVFEETVEFWKSNALALELGKCQNDCNCLWVFSRIEITTFGPFGDIGLICERFEYFFAYSSF